MSRKNRRATVKALVALAIAPALWRIPPASAQESLHIGILSSGILENRSPLDRALVEGLRDRGYVEGKNLTIERRYSSSRLHENAVELAGMKLDAVFTTCTPSTRMMKEITASTPIVMAAVSDPVRQGIVASLAKPGQNVTGTSSQAEDLLAKRLELLAAMLPKTSTIAVVVNANNPVHELGWQRLEAAARAMRFTLLKVELRKLEDLPDAVETAARAQAGAMFVMPDDPLMFNLRPRLVEVAAKYRLPDFYWAREFVDAGGLMSYGEDLRSSYRAGATYVDKIKKGANPGDLPVEQPTRFELVINMKTANALGLAVPRALLVQADEVIQ